MPELINGKWELSLSELTDFEDDCASGDIEAICDFYDRAIAPQLENKK